LLQEFARAFSYQLIILSTDQHFPAGIYKVFAAGKYSSIIFNEEIRNQK